MLFSSSVFLFVFFPIVLILYHIYFRGMRRAQNMLLLVASLLWLAVGALTFSRAMGCAMDCGTTAQY